MSDSSVKVAVRVRPFNSKEIGEGADLSVEMFGNMTRVFNKKTGVEKEFYFDYSYWSHDGFIVDETTGVSIKDSSSSNYADQHTVFNDLGIGVLDNAWAGYHCCLFAYGQTGSGKSYSMVGYGPNKGIIPIACEEIFKRIAASTDPFVQFKVGCSMLEIYNEQIQDLLQNPANRVKGGLRVREDPKKGVFIEGLKVEPVESYEQISGVLDQGNKHRTVAATQMNATSSRAHTVLTISFSQVFFDESTGQPLNRKESNINLVDLAGSERASKTEATGDRLKEGSNINKSLSTLGKVITALAKKSSGNLTKTEGIPYRESKLTRILQNALGGNSKTTMIAAISPALFNFDETISTLRYADQVKSIKNQAIVNETPQEKLIRELKEENERLKAMLDGKDVEGAPQMSQQEKEDYERMIFELQKAKEEAEKTWQQQLKENEQRMTVAVVEVVQATEHVQLPYITNLNEDPLLSGYIKNVIKLGTNKIGRKNPEEPPEIVIEGLGIGFDHCTIILEDETYTLKPSMDPSLKTMVNGKLLEGPVEIQHNDRIKFGNHNFFIFKDPEELDNKDYDWEFAVNEANEEEVKGLIGSEAEEMRQKEQEMKEKLEAEMEEARKKLEEERDQVSKLMNSHEEKDATTQKVIEERERMLQQRQAEIEEEYKKRQEALKVHEENRSALEKLKKILTLAIQHINEANERAEVLGKNVSFSPELYRETGNRNIMAPGSGLQDTKVHVRVNHPGLSSDINIHWSLDKLEARLVDMQDICNQLQYSGNSETELEYDPFVDDIDSLEVKPQLIGTANLHIDVVYYLLNLDLDYTPIINEKGQQQGSLKAALTSSLKNIVLEDHENIKELVGKELELTVQIEEAADIPDNYSTNVYCQYDHHLLGEEVFTSKKEEDTTTNPRFNYSAVHRINITEENTVQFLNNAISVMVFGDISQEKRLKEMHMYRQNLQKSVTIVPGQSPTLIWNNDVSVNMSSNHDVSNVIQQDPEEIKEAISQKEQEIQKIKADMLKQEEELRKKEEELRKQEEEIARAEENPPKKKSKACHIF